jgi:hypothetical protein
VYCGYMEFKMRAGLQDPLFADHDEDDQKEERHAA